MFPWVVGLADGKINRGLGQRVTGAVIRRHPLQDEPAADIRVPESLDVGGEGAVDTGIAVNRRRQAK